MDPTLLDQLAKAGLAPEHLKLLAPLLEQGQSMMQPQTAQGRQVGNTYVAASPLEHAANAIRQMVGANIAKNQMAKQQAIVGQQGQARQAYLQALQTAQQGGQGAPEMLARPPDPQAAQGLEMAGVASGDPVLRQSAEFGMQRAQLERQNRILENTLRHQQIMEDLDRQKVGAGNFEVIKDMYGNPTGTLDKRTNKFTPLAGGARPASAGLTPAARDMLANQGLVQGAVPRLGMGKAGSFAAMDVANRMAAMGGESPDLAGAKAGYHADTASLGKQQTLLDLTKSWEGTGKANLGVLRGVTQKLVDTGSPLINKPLRWIYQNAAGDPTVVQFKAAHAAVVNEYAKILSGSMGSAGVTEGARHEAESMIPLDATPAQVNAAADILEQDAGNRLGAMTKQVAETRARVSGKTPAVEAPAAASVALPRKTVGGKTYEKRPDGWYEVDGG